MSAPTIATASLSPEDKAAFEQFQEAFSFLSHPREDIRKMAVNGIAQHSKENAQLLRFLTTTAEGHAALDALLQCLHVGSKALLGDVLALLINVTAEDSRCVELLVDRRVVRRAMRLLDGLDRAAAAERATPDDASEDSQAKATPGPGQHLESLKEMTLMLLNNLTSVHVAAIDDVLQKEDDDLRGYYLNALQRYFDAMEEAAADHQKELQEKNDKIDETAEARTVDGAPPTDADSGSAEKSKTNSKSANRPRDLRRWILSIILNLTRTADGQELVLEEDWRTCLTRGLRSPIATQRWMAAQCFRNCAAMTHLRQSNATHQPHAAPPPSQQQQQKTKKKKGPQRSSEEETAFIHQLLLKGDTVDVIVARLSAPLTSSSSSAPQEDNHNSHNNNDASSSNKIGREGEPEIQKVLAECLAGLLTSEEGMARLESINAKQELVAAVKESQQARGEVGAHPNPRHEQNPNHNKQDARVVELGEDGTEIHEETGCTSAISKNTVGLLSAEVCTFLEDHVLVYLDDVIDAYVAPGSDELD